MPAILERMEFPEPVIEIAVEPKTKGDQEKLGVALNQSWLRKTRVIPRQVQMRNQVRQLLLAWASLHLDIIVDRMKREFKVEANVGQPQVAYRETITKVCLMLITHTRSSLVVLVSSRASKLTIEPGEARIQVSNLKVTPSSAVTVPKEYIPGVEKGVKSVVDNGILIGFPMLDVKVTLTDGAYHDVDSSPSWRLKSPVVQAFREGAQKASPQTTRANVMKVEVVTPDEYLGNPSWVTSIPVAVRCKDKSNAATPL